MPSPHSPAGSESGVHATGPRRPMLGWLGAKIAGSRYCAILALLALLAGKAAVVVAALASGQGLEGLGTRWDSEHFISVALHGYREPSDAAFAPLYPALIRLLAAPGLSPWQAALLAANLASLAAAAPLCALYGPAGAAAVLAFPTVALYTTAAYSEALALPLAAAGLYYTRRGKPLQAALTLALAALTRYQLGLPILALAILEARRSPRLSAALASGAAGAAAVVMAMHWHAYGNPLAYLEAEKSWDAGVSIPLLGQARWLLDSWFTRQPWSLAGHRIEPWMWLARNMVFYTIYTAGLVILAKRRLWPDLAWSLTTLLLVASLTGVPGVSAPRLLVMAFPAIAALALNASTTSITLYIAATLPLTLWATVWHLQSFLS